MGTACHVRGAKNVYDKFRRDLGVPGQEGTTRDLKFTLRQVRLPGVLLHGPGGPEWMRRFTATSARENQGS